jgi:hypothetical protein
VKAEWLVIVHRRSAQDADASMESFITRRCEPHVQLH